MAKEINFIADKLSVRGPKVDGSWVISLETGEYEREKISELIKLKGNVKVTIEPEPQG